MPIFAESKYMDDETLFNISANEDAFPNVSPKYSKIGNIIFLTMFRVESKAYSGRVNFLIETYRFE